MGLKKGGKREKGKKGKREKGKEGKRGRGEEGKMFFLDPKLSLGNQDEGEKAKGGKT